MDEYLKKKEKLDGVEVAEKIAEEILEKLYLAYFAEREKLATLVPKACGEIDALLENSTEAEREKIIEAVLNKIEGIAIKVESWQFGVQIRDALILKMVESKPATVDAAEANEAEMQKVTQSFEKLILFWDFYKKYEKLSRFLKDSFFKKEEFQRHFPEVQNYDDFLDKNEELERLFFTEVDTFCKKNKSQIPNLAKKMKPFFENLKNVADADVVQGIQDDSKLNPDFKIALLKLQTQAGVKNFSE